MLPGFYEKFQKVLNNVFMGSVVKRMVTVALTLKTAEVDPVVGVFSGSYQRVVRLSSCCVAVFFVSCLVVLSSASVFLRSALTSQCRRLQRGAYCVTHCC